MSKLILDSLEIQNFRAFRQLKIEKLGRVNLITGKNNVGKTSLLEALWLYARAGSPLLIRDILTSRNETRASSGVSKTRNDMDANGSEIENIRFLFYGRQDINKSEMEIEIGAVTSQERRLSIAIKWYQLIDDEDDEGQEITRLVPISLDEKDVADDALPYLVTQIGHNNPARLRLDRIFNRTGVGITQPLGIPVQSVRANGLNDNKIGQLWDNIALTVLEEDVLHSLQIITDVKRISVVGEEARQQGRMPVVITNGNDARLPLRSLGDGINRMFGIALSLVNVSDGILLVDEIENGLHYSVLPDVWRLIFKTAARLNVQVFATTHSWDCVTAFQKAAQEHEEKGVLIRLQNKNGEVTQTVFDENDLGIIVEDRLEVRG